MVTSPDRKKHSVIGMKMALYLATCSKCHSAAGLPLFIEQGVTIEQPHANGFNCATCHDNLEDYTRYVSESVTFPSGLTASLAEDEADTNGLESNLCMNCHQGRSSVNSVNAMIEGHA